MVWLKGLSIGCRRFSEIIIQAILVKVRDAWSHIDESIGIGDFITPAYVKGTKPEGCIVCNTHLQDPGIEGAKLLFPKLCDASANAATDTDVNGFFGGPQVLAVKPNPDVFDLLVGLARHLFVGQQSDITSRWLNACNAQGRGARRNGQILFNAQALRDVHFDRLGRKESRLSYPMLDKINVGTLLMSQGLGAVGGSRGQTRKR